MPRSFSMAIQSDVAWRADLRDFTAPAIWIAPPNSSNFSVSVVLPASGCEMIAKVRRRRVSVAWLDMAADLRATQTRHSSGPFRATQGASLREFGQQHVPELQRPRHIRRQQLFVEAVRKRVVGLGKARVDAVAGHAGIAEIHAVGRAGRHAGHD